MHPFAAKALKLAKKAAEEFGANSFCENTDEVLDVEPLEREFSKLAFADKKQTLVEVMKWKHGWALADVLLREDDDSLGQEEWEELDAIVHPHRHKEAFKPVMIGLKKPF